MADWRDVAADAGTPSTGDWRSVANGTTEQAVTPDAGVNVPNDTASADWRAVASTPVEAKPLPQTVGEEDARRVKELVGNVASYGKKVTDALGVSDLDPKTATEEQAYAHFERLKNQPLNTMMAPIGGALGVLQRNIGHPLMVSLMKIQHMQAHPELYKDTGLTMGEGGVPATDKDKDFAERVKASNKISWAQDVRPTKLYPASPGEAAMRRMGSATGGEAFKLTPAEEKYAVGELGQKLEGLPVLDGETYAHIALGAAEFAGELPYYSVPLGIAPRATKALRAGTVLGDMAPIEGAKFAAKTARMGSAIEFGAQSAAVASKNDQSVAGGFIEGFVAGQVLHRLGELVTLNSAAKKEVLASAAQVKSMRTGVLLPPITWKQYVLESIQAQKAPKTNAAPVTSAAGASVIPTKTPVIKGNATNTFTIKTIEYGEDGVLREVRYKQNTKTGKSTMVYSAPAPSREHAAELRKSGMPAATDLVAYADWMKEVFDPNPGKGVRMAGTVGYMSPEHQAAFAGLTLEEMDALASKIKYTDPISGAPIDYDPGYYTGVIEKPTAGSPAAKKVQVEEASNVIEGKFGAKDPLADSSPLPSRNPSGIRQTFAEQADAALQRSFDKSPPYWRIEQQNKLKELEAKGAANDNPVLLTAEPNGDVVATPIFDRTLDTTLKSPPRAIPGDAIEINGERAVMTGGNGDTVKARLSNGQHVEANQSSVSRINEHEGAPIIKATKPDDLLPYRKLDIHRVMHSMGKSNPAEAKAVIDELLAAKKIEHSPRAGEYTVTAKEVEIPKEGEGLYFYYAIDPNGQGKRGILRGKDPKKPGNWLLEIPSDPQFQKITSKTIAANTAASTKYGVAPGDIALGTKTISVPAEQVRTYIPVLKGRADMSRIADTYGVRTPMPKDAFVLPQKDVANMDMMTRMNGQVNRIVSGVENAKKVIRDFFVHDVWLVPTEYGGREKAITLASQASQVKAKSTRIQEHLANKLGGELSLPDTWLANIAKRRALRQGRGLSEQEKGLVRFFANNPQLDAEVRTTIETALARKKANEQTLASLGVTNIAELEAYRDAGLEEEYLTNVYLRNMMARKEWAEFVKTQLPDVWRNAVDTISRRFPKEGAQQVEARMLEILNLDIAKETQAFKTAPGGDAKAKLKERLDMHRDISNLLGKVDSASVQVAHSIAATDSLITRINTWNELAATPLWSPGPRIDLGPHSGVKVPDSAIFGKARGGYMHESFRFLVEAKPAHVEARSFLRTLSQMWKFNQVIGGGFTPWVNQFMRNWKGQIISGGVQSPSDFATFYDAAAEMLAYRKNPILNANSIYDEAMGNGTISTGFAGSEITKQKAANRILDAIVKQNGKARDIHELMYNVASVVKGASQEVGAMYDAIDRLHKLVAYKNIRRNALARGLSVNDAAAFAKMRVQEAFPNFELVAPTIEKLRNGSVSGIAPFLSSHAEEMRINGMLLMRLKNEPDLWARLMGWGAVMSSAAMLAREQRRANGISDADASAAKDTQTLGAQAYRTGAFVWPELDSKGRKQLVDMTQWESMAVLLNHHENDFLPAALMRNFITNYFGESTIPGQAVDLGFNAMTNVVPLSPIRVPGYRPGENGLINFMSMMAQNGAVPQGPMKWADLLRKSSTATTLKDQLTMEQWTPEQALAKFWGLPFAGPIGQQSEMARMMEFGRNVNELGGQMGGVELNQPEGPHKDFLREQKLKAIQKATEEMYGNEK